MHVEVHDSLARGLAIIDANVVARRGKFFIQIDFCFIEQRKERASLFQSRVKKRPDMPARNNQCVSRAYRKSIPDCNCEFVLSDDSCRRQGAKDARHGMQFG